MSDRMQRISARMRDEITGHDVDDRLISYLP